MQEHALNSQEQLCLYVSGVCEPLKAKLVSCGQHPTHRMPLTPLLVFTSALRKEREQIVGAQEVLSQSCCSWKDHAPRSGGDCGLQNCLLQVRIVT
eukprot:1152438-Pelagomonas_calceolata.AAC.3